MTNEVAELIVAKKIAARIDFEKHASDCTSYLMDPYSFYIDMTCARIKRAAGCVRRVAARWRNIHFAHKGTHSSPGLISVILWHMQIALVYAAMVRQNLVLRGSDNRPATID